MYSQEILCFVIYLLGAQSVYLSVSITRDEEPNLDYMNETLGSNIKTHCKRQRQILGLPVSTSDAVYRWHYDPRSNDLMCVCSVHNVTERNGRLRQPVQHSRAIAAINYGNFRENKQLQGGFAYILHVEANSNPEETAQVLFRGETNEDILLKNVRCKAWNITGGFMCTVVYHNRANVSWDYPELWIAPVRHLQSIAYNNSAISIQFIDIFWSKAIVGGDQYLYVDTALSTQRNDTDICRRFLNLITDAALKLETKCRVELQEEKVANQLFHITKLNLLVPGKLVIESSTVAAQMRLANKLRWFGVSCRFPVQLRTSDAFYVPSHMLPNGKHFTFTVTYAHSVPEGLDGQSSNEDVCDKLKSYGKDLIETCYGRVRYTNYSTIKVLMKATNASVWELQYKLMYLLNLPRPDQCMFNVANTPILKGY